MIHTPIQKPWVYSVILIICKGNLTCKHINILKEYHFYVLIHFQCLTLNFPVLYSYSIWFCYNFCGSISSGPIIGFNQQCIWNSIRCLQIHHPDEKTNSTASTRHWHLVQHSGRNDIHGSCIKCKYNFNRITESNREKVIWNSVGIQTMPKYLGWLIRFVWE